MIQDDYRRLEFKQPTENISFKVGMMVQIVESNDLPLKWKWIELDKKLILRLKDSNLNFVRLPNYTV